MDLVVIAGLQGVMLLALALIGHRAELGTWYFGSLFIVAGLMARHTWLARRRDREGCFQAFLENHVIGLVVFVGILLDYTFAVPA